MNGQMVLDKIMDTYRPNFDVEEPYEFHGEVYDAYAGFSMTSAKYVLVKRAELWRAHCFEHAFFSAGRRYTLEIFCVSRSSSWSIWSRSWSGEGRQSLLRTTCIHI